MADRGRLIYSLGVLREGASWCSWRAEGQSPALMGDGDGGGQSVRHAEPNGLSLRIQYGGIP